MVLWGSCVEFEEPVEGGPLRTSVPQGQEEELAQEPGGSLAARGASVSHGSRCGKVKGVVRIPPRGWEAAEMLFPPLDVLIPRL